MAPHIRPSVLVMCGACSERNFAEAGEWCLLPDQVCMWDSCWALHCCQGTHSSACTHTHTHTFLASKGLESPKVKPSWNNEFSSVLKFYLNNFFSKFSTITFKNPFLKIIVNIKLTVCINSPTKFWYVYFIGIYDTYLLFTNNRTYLNLSW